MNANEELVDARAMEHDRLLALLREDVPYGDLTTRSLGLAGRRGVMRFSARAPMRAACIEHAVRIVQLAGADATAAVASGASVEAGGPLLSAQGDAAALLGAWKVAQTLVEAASGIATATAAIVDALRAAGHAIPLACTRKNAPGTRWWAAEAVQAGGGVMHRLGLSESLLVFPEHRAFIASGDRAGAIAALRAAQPEKRLVVEVGDAAEAVAMARAGAEVLQLERFAPAALAELRDALAQEGLRPLLAPAGGVTAANALAYAEAGADLLVSSAPYLAPPADVKVTIAAIEPSPA